MTIDELARRAGSTSRNVRAYQERGLLHPPRKVGRTGYYDASHLERLETIARLLGEGFSLAAIGSLLEAWDQGGSLADVLGFQEALTAPFSDERPQVMTLDQIYEMLPGETDAGYTSLNRAVEAGIVALRDDGAADVVTPHILELGRTLHEVGMPVDALTDELLDLRRDADRIAHRFVQLFLDHVWAPFEAAGAPPDELPRITEALDRLRPVPGQATSTIVAHAMRHQLDEVVERLLEVARASSPAPDPPEADPT